MILIQDINNIQTFLELITSFKVKYIVQEKKSFLRSFTLNFYKLVTNFSYFFFEKGFVLLNLFFLFYFKSLNLYKLEKMLPAK